MKPSSKSRTKAGFTLIELCVAAAILVLGFAGLMGMLSVGRASASLVENQLAAMHIARGMLEDLRKNDYYSAQLSAGTKQLSGNRGTYVVADVGDGWTKNITVNINWEEPSGAIRTVSLTTSFSRTLHR